MQFKNGRESEREREYCKSKEMTDTSMPTRYAGVVGIKDFFFEKAKLL
jgi:hypothetical protein